MKEYCGNHFILNGEVREVKDFDNSLVFKGETVYEVIRMASATPVFFNDHMDRLSTSVKIQNRKMIADPSILRNDIIRLSVLEKRREINLKIVFNYTEDSENYLIYYIESNYPTQEQYRKGVKGILFWGQRHEPQSKVLDIRLRSAIYQELAEENAYEAILVNNDNLITEGSRSNVFFIMGDKLITAPHDCILKGVTRKHILEICHTEHIETEFSCVNADNLGLYEAAFMTGTSPGVLPYCCINETFFNVTHPLMHHLRTLYMNMVEESIRQFTFG